MPICRNRHLRAATALLMAAMTMTGCASGGSGKPTAVAPAPSADQPPAGPAEGPIGMSPGGVTTKIDVPAQSTEEQYAQACLAAKEWMDSKGGDPHTLVEPFLKDIQGSADSGPATFKQTWAELDDAHRAAVIIAVTAAADGGC